MGRDPIVCQGPRRNAQEGSGTAGCGQQTHVRGESLASPNMLAPLKGQAPLMHVRTSIHVLRLWRVVLPQERDSQLSAGKERSGYAGRDFGMFWNKKELSIGPT